MDQVGRKRETHQMLQQDTYVSERDEPKASPRFASSMEYLEPGAFHNTPLMFM